MEGYKIVAEVGDELLSIGLSHPIACRYQLHKETVRPDNCGPLAVFSNLSDLLFFMAYEHLIRSLTDLDIYRIFLVTYEQSNDTILWYYHDDVRYTKVLLPSGTMLADNVELDKEITLEDLPEKDLKDAQNYLHKK